MSLVYEALQKAAREKNRFAGPPPTPFPVSVAVPAMPKRSPTLWVAGASLVTFTIVVTGVVLFLRKPVATSALVTTPVTAVAPAQVAPVTPLPTGAAPAPIAPAIVAPAPVPVLENSTANDPRFKLTGIMKMGDNYGAVINGHIVYREHYVDGAIVKRVESDRVTLNVDGRDVVVRLF